MSIPDKPKPYYLKDPLDRAIDEFAKIDKPTPADLNKVTTVASIQTGLDKYHQKAASMSRMELELEKHNSARLAKFLEV